MSAGRPSPASMLRKKLEGAAESPRHPPQNNHRWLQGPFRPEHSRRVRACRTPSQAPSTTDRDACLGPEHPPPPPPAQMHGGGAARLLGTLTPPVFLLKNFLIFLKCLPGVVGKKHKSLNPGS